MCFSRSPFFTWKKFLAKNANCITSLKIFLRRDDYGHSVVPPPRAVLWSRDLSAIFGSLDVLGAGSSPLQGAEAPSQSNQNSRKCMGSHEKSGSGALPGLVLPAAQRHCGGAAVLSTFPFCRPQLQHPAPGPIADRRFFIRAGEKLPSALPMKVHGTHGHLPRPLMVRVEGDAVVSI